MLNIRLTDLIFGDLTCVRHTFH